MFAAKFAAKGKGERMRTDLEFNSNFFEPIDGEEDETNPGIFGKALAQFLSDEFELRGYETDIFPEDWGWHVELSPTSTPLPYALWFGCSSYDDVGDWLIQIHPHKPIIRRWFKKYDVTLEVKTVASLIEEILVQKAAATNLRWWSDAESGRK